MKGSGSVQVDERMKVTLERVDYPDFNATEWVLWFENPGNANSGILSDILDGDVCIPLPKRPPQIPYLNSVPGDRAVITMKGCIPGAEYSYNDLKSATEFMPVTHYLRGEQSGFSCQNQGGRSSDTEAPFFEVSQNGQGAIVALGWTGDWKASFRNKAEGVQVGVGLQNARFYLKPGEKLRTSRVLVMNFGKDEDASNKFRRLIRRHFSHVAGRPGTREGLFAYELWGGLTSDEMVRRLRVLKSHGLTFEDVWIDAGWYGDCEKCDDAYTGDWAAKTGDWDVNLRVHPDEFENVRDAARKEVGAGIMLWFEPERMTRQSKAATKHADLVMKGCRNWGSWILDYGKEAARRYVVDCIDAYAKRLRFSCYRQDANWGLTRYFKEADEPDRRGITEIRHIMGLYQVWDELLKRNPGMLIDNCASGGRRLDLETLRRSVFFFRSDFQCGFNANADVIQTHNVGLSRLIPYNGCTTKLSDLYSLRSSYSASLGVAYWNTIFQKEEEVDWAAAKKSHDEYLRIRKYFPCDFYNHGSQYYDPGAWAVWQYHDPESRSGIIMAFRRPESPCDRAQITLKGITRGSAITTESLDTGAKGTCADGVVEISLPEKRSSTIILYREGCSTAKR